MVDTQPLLPRETQAAALTTNICQALRAGLWHPPGVGGGRGGEGGGHIPWVQTQKGELSLENFKTIIRHTKSQSPGYHHMPAILKNIGDNILLLPKLFYCLSFISAVLAET